MVHISTEQLLSCTAGQLKQDYSAGVSHEELEMFVELFQKNLNQVSISICYPIGDRIYYSDSWKIYFDYHMGKYNFKCNEDINKKTIITNINLLTMELINNGLSENEAKTVIQNSINEFLNYHNNLCDSESIFIQQKTPLAKKMLKR